MCSYKIDNVIQVFLTFKKEAYISCVGRHLICQWRNMNFFHVSTKIYITILHKIAK